MLTFWLHIEGAYRKPIEEATKEFQLEIPVQPISPQAASLILSSLAEDTPLVTSVWPYTDFPVWDTTALTSVTPENTTMQNYQNYTSQINSSSGFFSIISPSWKQNRLQNVNISRDSTLRVGGKMRNGAKVRVEIYTHLERKLTHDVFGIVRGAIEPGDVYFESFNISIKIYPKETDHLYSSALHN